MADIYKCLKCFTAWKTKDGKYCPKCGKDVTK